MRATVFITDVHRRSAMPRGRPRKTQGDILLKSAEMIGWAIGGIEREILATRDRLTALTAQANALREKLPGGRGARGVASTSSDVSGQGEGAAVGRRTRRRMSPEARKRISDMMRKKWAERREASGKGASGRKRKRSNISPEGRKRISEMMKKRWAERRKAAK
jgi:hypothetical protein